MSGLQNELGPKGFQVIESAINENPDVPGFMRTFQTPFPVGVTPNNKASEFMQLPIFVRSFVPFFVLIDRQGTIRYQHTGSETGYFTDNEVQQAANMRAEAEKLLAERPPRPVTKAPAKKGTK